MKTANKVARSSPRVRAKMVVKSLLNNDMSPLAAAKELGISRQAIHKQMNKNPYVKKALEAYCESLEKAGVNDERSVRVILEAMKATKTVWIDGPSRTEVQVPDHAIRLKANDQYLRIKGFINGNSSKTSQFDSKPLLRLVDSSSKTTDELMKEIASKLTTLSPN